MKTILLALTLLLFATTLWAKSAKERADQTYSGFPNIVRDIQYKTVEGFDDTEQLSMDLILPKKNLYQNGAPVVIYIHGGGWSGGERYVLGKDTFEPFTDKGIAVACISYRLAKDGYSALDCLIDCKDAARFLAKNAEKYELDPERFATTGHSAGGHLTLCTALVPNNEPLLAGDPSLNGQNPTFVCAAAKAPLVTLFHPEEADSTGTIAVKPKELQKIIGGKSEKNPSAEEMATNTGREKFIATIQTQAPVAGIAKTLSPEFWLDKTSPAILVIHGTTDSLISVRGARYFKNLADERGAHVTYIEVENGGHDFKSKDPEKVPSHTFQELDKISAAFLIEHLLTGIKAK